MKKIVFISLGVLAVAGISYFLYKKYGKKAKPLPENNVSNQNGYAVVSAQDVVQNNIDILNSDRE